MECEKKGGHTTRALGVANTHPGEAEKGRRRWGGVGAKEDLDSHSFTPKREVAEYYQGGMANKRRSRKDLPIYWVEGCKNTWPFPKRKKGVQKAPEGLNQKSINLERMGGKKA